MASIKDSLNELDALTALYELEFRKAANERLREYVESVTDAMPRFGPNAYACPCCGSGTGVNGRYTPAFHLFRRQNGEMAFKCHACGISGDVFTLAGLMSGVRSHDAQRRIVADFLGVDLSRRTPLDSLKAPDGKAPPSFSAGEEARLRRKAHGYILECKKHVDETGFFTARGLSHDTVKRFNLGYDPQRKLAIIPFTSSYYVGRNTRVGTDKKAIFKHSNPRGLKQPLFNMAALRQPAVFVTEAPLDAISIVQSGGAAVALGGTSLTEFGRILKVYRPETCLILAMDSDGPGRRAQSKLAGMLTDMGISFTLPEHPVFSTYKDANAALMANPEQLKEAIAAETTRALAVLVLNRAETRRFATKAPSRSQDLPTDLSAAKREAARTASKKNAARADARAANKQTLQKHRLNQEAR